jgi:hypothetical protein
VYYLSTAVCPSGNGVLCFGERACTNQLPLKSCIKDRAHPSAGNTPVNCKKAGSALVIPCSFLGVTTWLIGEMPHDDTAQRTASDLRIMFPQPWRMAESRGGAAPASCRTWWLDVYSRSQQLSLSPPLYRAIVEPDRPTESRRNQS